MRAARGRLASVGRPTHMAEASVRISLSAGELEIRGSEDFVAKYDGVVDELLDKLRDVPVTSVATNVTAPNGSSGGGGGATNGGELPPFGEMLHRLPSDATGTDRILLAGLYAQRDSADSTFATAEANKMLIEQGIKLSNPTQSLNNAQSAKRVFKVGKRWKVAKPGEDHLKSMGAKV